MGKVIVIAMAIVLAIASVSVQGDRSEPGTGSAVAAVRHTRVRLSTGVELQVAEAGAADGEPVLFLHGYTDSWFSWSLVLQRLPSRIRAIVPTQRGHGDSERPGCCYGLGNFAADAVALLDELGIERATVVGHSMGSLVAQRIAIEHPQRVERLLLIGSGATARSPAVLEFNQSVQELTDPVPPAFVRDFQQSTVSRVLPPGFLDTVVEESGKVPAQVWRATIAGLLSPDAKHALDRITANTLIIWGEQDAFFPRAEQDSLLRAIRGSRLVVYEQTAHSPSWEAPDRVVADLLEFMGVSARTMAGPEHSHEAHSHGRTGKAGEMPLLPGLGDWQHVVTTTAPLAQRYFDQGLRLMYAFNHDEAERSFEGAVLLDSACAMCYWGIAYSVAPNINQPMDAAAESRGLAAIRQAVRWKQRVTPLEAALIEAMARRFGEPAGTARAARDSAYAAAMREVARRFPDDVDTQVLFADAMMNLRPWSQWTRDGKPQPGTEEVVAALERALKREPNHAGACHFYVHAVEASETPERALPCAERLPRLMPGAGHIVHMPAHVFLRVGRYEAAARANIAAVEADRRYFAEQEVKPGVYPMFYAPHNIHFLWATYLLSGQRAKALSAARALEQRVSLNDARAAASLESFLVSPMLTLARFRDWDAVLAEPAPPSDLRYVKGVWHYSRGLARAGRGELNRARLELDSVRAIAARVPQDMMIILNRAPVLLNIAAEVLAAEIALQQTQFDAAIAHLQSAARLEDGLTYDEPPAWYHSARNLLGEALLAAGRPAQAEAAFREDLRYVRETGWSLSGLERALRAQGKNREAADAARRLKEAWKYADVPAAGR